MNKMLILGAIAFGALLLAWAWDGQAEVIEGDSGSVTLAPNSAPRGRAEPTLHGLDLSDRSSAPEPTLSPDGDGIAIPERYRLPEFPVGMTNGEFLAAYWGAAWPEYEQAIRGTPFEPNLDSINSNDWSVGRPIGTIEDFFENLLERTLERFEMAYGAGIYQVPGLATGSFLRPEGLAKAVLKSKRYAPPGLVVSPEQFASLEAFLADRAATPTLVRDDIMARWRELITDDVSRIVKFEDPIHGRAFISPILSLAWNTQPLVGTTKPYPVADVVLPSAPRDEVGTAAGFFNGVLTIWAGSDSVLAYLYDELATSDTTFEADVQAFMAGL